MFNKRKERDKTVHYEDYNIASNSGDQNHDIVTHSIQLEPQNPNQGLRTHKKRSSYHTLLLIFSIVLF
jgi:ribosomal protein S12